MEPESTSVVIQDDREHGKLVAYEGGSPVGAPVAPLRPSVDRWVQRHPEAPGELVRGAERQLESHPSFSDKGPGGKPGSGATARTCGLGRRGQPHGETVERRSTRPVRRRWRTEMTHPSPDPVPPAPTPPPMPGPPTPVPSPPPVPPGPVPPGPAPDPIPQPPSPNPEPVPEPEPSPQPAG